MKVQGADIMSPIPFRKSLLGLGVAIALGGGTVACSDRPSTSESVTQSEDARTAVADTAVTAMVKTRLAGDSTVPASDIQVTTNNGVVVLEGTVPSDYVKSTAGSVARSVDGVARVDNNLIIATSPDRSAEASRIASDTWITTKVKSMLLADSVGQGLEISVDTRDGVVTLTGALEDENDLEHVKDIAAEVEGVRNVDTRGLVVATGN
jgi:hyperosmotically inducible periplasmic protein